MSRGNRWLALHLATTGPDPERDAVAAVAAIAFDGDGQETATFASRARAAVDSPAGWTTLPLGAAPPAELDPPVEAVLGRLAPLLADSVVVGVDAPAQVELLRRHGLRLAPPALDTLELAAVALPGLRWPDLPGLFAALGVPWAADDEPLEAARTQRRLFEAVLARFHALPPESVAAVSRLATRSKWALAPAFRAAPDTPRRRRPPPAAPVSRPEALRPVPKPVQVDITALEALLAPGGRLDQTMPGFEDRPGQRDMLRRVAEALGWGDRLLVEAGTGTGKSLAYLLPAAAWALANRRPVVVSTHTTSLQEQLFTKDIPLVAGLLPEGLTACVLKGRSNYLCRTRLAGALGRDDLELDTVRGLAKILVWAAGTSTGDRAELNLVGPEERAWRLVSAEGDTCTPERCPHARQGQDWLQRARARAEGCHLVVVNHALLLADVRVENRLLPAYSALVIDEAHHLEAVATDQLGLEVGQLRLRDLLASLESGGRGILARLTAAVNLSDLPEARRAALVERCEARAADVRGAVPAVAALFDRLAAFLAEHAEGNSLLRLTEAVRADGGWSAVELAWDDLRTRLIALRQGLGPVATAVSSDEALIEDAAALGADLASALRELGELETGLERLVSRPTSGDVTWIERTGTDRVSLHLAPLHVGEALTDGLWEGTDTVILTSATLTTDDGFRLVKGRLGLAEASEAVVESPFDYEASTLVYVPLDMPEPGQPGYQQALGQVVTGLGRVLGGRTLVLFTSYGSLNSTYHHVRQPLGRAGVSVLGQGIDGERSQLMARFREPDRPTVLLGTRSFWEGIDVPGEALSCLVITRLPFDVPSDPVFAARAETFENPFFEYAVPQAILRFRQGFGRLIRSGADRGVVVVLDRRVESKGYGRQFLDALPPCNVHRGPVRDMGNVVRGFMGAWEEEG
jgi:DNA polymerase-3 subunit epsilon/ATP-dependent DNA helicase DinG